MADEEKEALEKKKKGGLVTKLIVLIIGTGVLGAGAFVGWTYFSNDSKEVAVEKQVVKKSQMYPMGPKVVNLLDNNGERYLKVDIQLEVSNSECMADLEQLKPKITDAVLVLLSSKNYKEIADFEGKQRLRDEIAMRLNSYLTRGRVQKVYFTEFIIQ
jgi:flagellar FliL protein